MRIVVYGAGAVGGVIGGRLFEHASEHGHDVVCIARGEHYEAVRERGLRVHAPEGEVTVRVPHVRHPSEIDWRTDDIVILSMKTHHTQSALDDLRAAAGVVAPSLTIVCAQNGVENERIALRVFPRVYGICVMLPATMLVPGEVVVNMTPRNGVLDVGRYPAGRDEQAETIAAALYASNFESRAEATIMRQKHHKLLLNLGNPISAACGPEARTSSLFARAKEEAIACYRTAAIDWASDEEDAARRSAVRLSSVPGQVRTGGSTWQSLARGTGSTEVDYLNGEIVLLGRLHGVPTPVNEGLCRVVADMARRGAPPASMTLDELEANVASQ